MPFQDVPTTAHHPDYGVLKREPLNREAYDVDQVLDHALSDDPASPKLSVLKNLVREFMLKPGTNGGIFVPNTWQAMAGVRHVINANPDLANPELVKSLTHTAMHDGECFFIADHEVRQLNTGSGDDFPMGREAAVRALGKVVEKRPDLADAALVNNLSQISRNEPDSAVRAQIQYLLGEIAAQRPDLINEDMVKAVSATASSIKNYPENTGTIYSDAQPGHITLLGYRSDELDTDARNRAEETLRTVRSTRPDLFPAQESPVNTSRRNSAASHSRGLSPPSP